MNQKEAKNLSDKQKCLTAENMKQLQCMCAASVSPNGKYLAYLSETEPFRQIWCASTEEDGTPIKLTSLRYGIERFGWLSDGSGLWFTAPVYAECSDPLVEMQEFEKKEFIRSKAKMIRTAEKIPFLCDAAYGIDESCSVYVGLVTLADKKQCLERETVNDSQKMKDYGYAPTLETVINFNPWLRDYKLCETKLIESYYEECNAALTLPNRKKEKKYPLLLYVCDAADKRTTGFDFEAQVIAAAGYAVLRCEVPADVKWEENDVNAEKCFSALMQLTDRAVSEYDADETRLALAGAAAPYAVSRTKRFQKAISLRAIWNPSTAYGTSVWNFDTQTSENEKTKEAELENDFRDKLKDCLRNSLVSRIDDIDAAMLILQGEKDCICNMEQAEQLFHAMQDRRPDVPSRLVIFPGENHEIQLTGTINARIYHLQEIIQWLDADFTEKEDDNDAERDE